MANSPFVVPVSDLVSVPGSRRKVDVDAPVDWGFELSDVGPTLHADLTMENASDALVVRGPVRTTLGLTCHRCLTEWEEELVVELTEVFGLGADADEDEDSYRLEGDVADLEPMLRDTVLLEVPLRPLCEADCRGLCATCGADLNTDSCPGHDEESTSPFAVLRDLLEP